MAKKYLKKITDALGIRPSADPEMPVIKSTYEELPSEYGWDSVKVLKYNPHNAPSPEYVRKMRDESKEFYESDAGKNRNRYNTKNGDKVMSPDAQRGSGFGDSYGNRQHQGGRTMSPKQMSDFIAQHAAGNYGAKIDDFNAGLRVKDGMGDKPFNPKDYYDGKPKSFSTQSTKPDFMPSGRDWTMGVAGATGAALGYGASKVINKAMEKNGANREQSQSDAHGYWTRKKNGQ